ncbi:alpha/beta fold hydrolase [Streptomyces anulatus]|uniref:thioesterase II family protein n=1 Tax=Streptomyces anulatus TaxID=1892 RepID=UPI002251B84C|nr:alpha/beta fold hydrolase [Streptomyces anulatus]MCX4521951.1 alpha/beta fold hydrolase [Streptomyces anulatus]MCX4604827.1 alpha/beta fold hydrolase [Streptomyces anulatus]WTE29650.1 alpha/beta fold hydrolase [Streptomyces anulatus]
MRSTGGWFLHPPSPDAEARLFCLPYAGTGASSYRRWPSRIGELEVCAVQPPGREGRIREAPYETFDAFAEGVAEALRPYLDRPYALFGHCMGALLGHALAARLETLEVCRPSLLVVSSAKVPHEPPERRYRPPRPGLKGVFHPSMTDAQFAGEIQAVVDGTGGGEVLPELVPLAVRVLRNDVEMCFRYTATGPRRLTSPITAIGWTDDPETAPADMSQWHAYGSVRQRVLAGGKLTYLSAPAALTRLIDEEFTEAITDAASNGSGAAS